MTYELLLIAMPERLESMPAGFPLGSVSVNAEFDQLTPIEVEQACEMFRRALLSAVKQGKPKKLEAVTVNLVLDTPK